MIVVGSTNPAKVAPVRDVFAALHPDRPVVGEAVPSGVPDQPIGHAQTREGALARADGALARPGATWGVGLEGGVEFDEAGVGWLFGVVAVRHGPRAGIARTASLELPPGVAARVRAGEELGPVLDEWAGTVALKTRGGGVGLLTGGLLERADVWRQGVVLALAPFRRPEWYPDGT